MTLPMPLPPQGLYDAFMPSDVSGAKARLNQMATGGFKVVINYSNFYCSASQLITWADNADAFGMKIMWGFSDPIWYDGSGDPLSEYATLAATSGASTIDEFSTYIVSLVKNHPATMAYYVADEPDAFTDPSLTLSQVEHHAGVIKAEDPDHPTTLAHFYQYWDCTIRLRQFQDAVDWLGFDIYPLATGSPPDCRPLSDISDCAPAGQSLADSLGKKLWVVGQAHKILNCVWDATNGTMVTAAQMRQIRDNFLNNCAPEVLMWWWYPDAAGTPQSWADLVWAAGAQDIPRRAVSTPAHNIVYPLL